MEKFIFYTNIYITLTLIKYKKQATLWKSSIYESMKYSRHII